MLYLLYGTDSQKVRSKVRELVNSLLKREPEASYFRLTDETFTKSSLTEYLIGQGLFSQKVLIVLDSVLSSDEGKEIVFDRIKDIESSGNIFVILENKLDNKSITKLEKHAKKSQEFRLKLKTESLRRDFSIFSLTDAIGNRNKKKAWVMFQQALRSGMGPEEIHGMFFWQVKIMILVAQESVTGLKPFVVSKARVFLNNWGENELKDLSSNLVSVYHEARLGKFDMDIGLERLILQSL